MVWKMVFKNYFKNVVEKTKKQEFSLKSIDKARNYFLEEIEQNQMMSRKHKKVCITRNCLSSLNFYLNTFLL